MTKNHEGRLGTYLGRRVYVEAFSRRRWGVICSVYRHGENVEVEVEFNDGEMSTRQLKALHVEGEIPA